MRADESGAILLMRGLRAPFEIGADGCGLEELEWLRVRIAAWARAPRR